MASSITPEKLRDLALGFAPRPMGNASPPTIIADALNAAADEIERLQSDVTELMSACNEALNDRKVKP